MEDKEYHSQLQSVFFLAAMVRPLKVSDVLRAMEHAETVGPILDPTMYIMTARNLEWQKRLAQATLRFQQEVEGIASDPRYTDRGLRIVNKAEERNRTFTERRSKGEG
jgi:hypothetical protein